MRTAGVPAGVRRLLVVLLTAGAAVVTGVPSATVSWVRQPFVLPGLNVAPAQVSVDAGEAVGVCLTARDVPEVRAARLFVAGAPQGVRAEVRHTHLLGRSCAQLAILTDAAADPGDYWLTVVAETERGRASCALMVHVSAAEGLGFDVQSQITGLEPGSSRALDLTIANGNRMPIRVTSLSVAVDQVDDAHRACDVAGSYALRPLTGSTAGLWIRAGHRRSLTSLGVAPAALPQISMHRTGAGSSACRGATLTVGYHATASSR